MEKRTLIEGKDISSDKFEKDLYNDCQHNVVNIIARLVCMSDKHVNENDIFYIYNDVNLQNENLVSLVKWLIANREKIRDVETFEKYSVKVKKFTKHDFDLVIKDGSKSPLTLLAVAAWARNNQMVLTDDNRVVATYEETNEVWVDSFLNLLKGFLRTHTEQNTLVYCGANVGEM